MPPVVNSDAKEKIDAATAYCEKNWTAWGTAKDGVVSFEKIYGQIHKDEEEYSMYEDIQELFDAVDTTKSGTINFMQYVQFAVLF